MKKPIILLLLLTSLIGYLEWGGDNNGFLFEIETVVWKKLWSNPGEALHPFTILPMLGQGLLLVALFQKKPNRWLTIAGLVCLSTIMLMVFVIGALTLNWKIILCSLPFMVTAVVAVMQLRRKKSA